MNDQAEMTEENQTDETQIQEPTDTEVLDALKAKADLIGVSYSHKIGAAALRKKIKDHIEGVEEDEAVAAPEPKAMSKAERYASIRQKQMKECMALVRVRITNMNPDKADLGGEIFAVGTKYIGTVKKYIPYGEATDNGYHVPKILLDQMKQREFLSVKSVQNRKTGQMDITQRWVREFAIEELPPLTDKELKDLATQQAAKVGMD